MQSFVYTRVAWATANTKSNPSRFVYSRSLPDFIYNRSLPVFVYTRSRPRFCLYQVITRFVYRGAVFFNHTSVHGAASAWAAGTLPSSDCDGACTMASVQRVSWSMALVGAGWGFQYPTEWASGLGVLMQQLRAGRLRSRRWCLDVGRSATAGSLSQASL